MPIRRLERASRAFMGTGVKEARACLPLQAHVVVWNVIRPNFLLYHDYTS